MTTYLDLMRLSDQLDSAAQRLNREVEAAEEQLRMTKIRVYGLVETQALGRHYLIGWEQLGEQWRLTFALIAPDGKASGRQPLCNASREVRARGLRAVPALLAEIEKRAATILGEITAALLETEPPHP